MFQQPHDFLLPKARHSSTTRSAAGLANREEMGRILTYANTPVDFLANLASHGHDVNGKVQSSDVWLIYNEYACNCYQAASLESSVGLYRLNHVDSSCMCSLCFVVL